MTFWDKVKKDVQKGFKEGIAFMKEGANVVMEKAEALTDEGKKRLKIFDLQTKVQKEIGDLGGRVYDLSDKKKNPMLDKKVNAIVSRLKKLELQIKTLESAPTPKTKKKISKRTTAKSTTSKRTAVKRTTAKRTATKRTTAKKVAARNPGKKVPKK